MHGQVKVKRTEQQKIEEKNRRAKENIEFLKLMTACLDDRQHSVSFNESVFDKLTTILSRHPGFLTIWNHRREMLLVFFSSGISADLRDKKLKDELDLTRTALLSDPKSYGAWHHRSWVLSQHQQPNWDSELALCDEALKLDERNFHCWDFRRFVVQQSGTSDDSELQFSQDLIERNLSNYSAWHYRSSLLNKKEALSTKDELDLVHNAIYTDSKDQSPWFYYWWLLSRGDRKSYLREMYISRLLKRIVLVFTACKSRADLDSIEVEVKALLPENDQVSVYSVAQLNGWTSALEGDVSAVWWLDLLPTEVGQDLECSLIVSSRDLLEGGKSALTCTMLPDQSESLVRVDLDPVRLLNPAIAPIHEPESLREELALVEELVEMEPSNKWALLSLLSLLRYVSPPDASERIEQIVERLVSSDAQRRRYYLDLASEYKMEDTLSQLFKDHSRTLSLPSAGLTCLPWLDWSALMTSLDLSGNKLDQLPETLAYLLCLTQLILDNNRIRNLSAVGRLPSLKMCSVRDNRLEQFESLEPAMACVALLDLYISGNEVAALPDLTELLAASPHSSKRRAPLSVHYSVTDS